jgi:acetyl-CoA carboxylase beta subunit
VKNKKNKMDIKIVTGVFESKNDLLPKGISITDEDGDFIECTNCGKGIIYIDLESKNKQCTECDFVE